MGLVALAAVLLAGCAGTSGPIALRTSMDPGQAKAFGALVETYNKAHVDAAIAWQNAPTGKGADGETPAWEILPAAAARLLDDRQPFASQIAPKLLHSLVPGFRDWLKTDTAGTFVPLLGVQPVMIVDNEAVSKGLGNVPSGLGEVFRRSSEHRQKVGRLLFAPPFGEPEMVLRFVHSQGVTVLDAQGRPVYPAGELGSALGPWVAAFQSGDLPKACLDWDEAEAAKQVIRGVADMTVGGPVAMAVFEARPDKRRKFHLFRPVTGEVEDQWLDPIGLVHHRQGAPNLGEQNMIAFLLSDDVQTALANGYQASPLVETARHVFPRHAAGVTPVMETYVASVSVFAKHGIPLAPLEPTRAQVAAGIRTALVKAVAGVPIAEAVAAGKAVADGGQ
jgi:hypothetical protein